MERSIVFSYKSEQQLDEIYNNILSLSNDEATAKKYVNELIQKTEILKKYPFTGRELILVDSIKTYYRYIHYKKYVIFYRVDDKNVYIDRILSSNQDYVNEFTNEI